MSDKKPTKNHDVETCPHEKTRQVTYMVAMRSPEWATDMIEHEAWGMFYGAKMWLESRGWEVVVEPQVFGTEEFEPVVAAAGVAVEAKRRRLA